jgi:hypothetical protein
VTPTCSRPAAVPPLAAERHRGRGSVSYLASGGPAVMAKIDARAGFSRFGRGTALAPLFLAPMPSRARNALKSILRGAARLARLFDAQPFSSVWRGWASRP